MTEEDKKLLLVDLCSRLPYAPYYLINGDDKPRKILRYSCDDCDGFLLDFMADENSDYPIIQIYASEVKSYLRPMESMTKKEKKVVNNLIYNKESIWISPIPIWVINESDIEEYIDFCNSHHHDTETALNYVQNRMIVETCKNSNVEIEGATFKIVHKDKCEKTVILLINKEEAYHLLEEIQIILQNKVKKYKQEFEEL